MQRVLTIKEVQAIINVSKSKAAKMIQHLRIVLDKPKPKIVTVEDFLKYYEL